MAEINGRDGGALIGESFAHGERERERERVFCLGLTKRNKKRL